MDSLVGRVKQTEVGQRLAEQWAVRQMLFRALTVPFYLRRGHVRRTSIVQRYLASTAEPRLQFGAGPMVLEGWLNSDVISGDVYIDLTRRFPLPDRSFAYVFGEHMIEHVDERRGVRAIEQMFRILRPGGTLRLTTPDLCKVIAIYEDRNPVVSREDYGRHLSKTTGKRHERRCQIVNTAMRAWGHQYVYDEEDLRAKLEAAGFVEVVRQESGESDDPALRGLEQHGEEWGNAAEAMSLEATRPA